MTPGYLASLLLARSIALILLEQGLELTARQAGSVNIDGL